MPNWVHNSMKITGAAEEIARFKQTCFRAADSEELKDEPGCGAVFDFNTITPMPEVLRDSESSSVVTYGLLILGRDDLTDGFITLVEMLDWPWVKDKGVTTVEQLKTLLLERAPDAIQKAEQAIANHEQTGFTSWIDWAYENWGTKWNAGPLGIIHDEPKCFECCFDTANGAPLPVWKKIGEMFPTLTFELNGCEPDNDRAFRGTIKHGKLQLRDVPLMWETTDPKTGNQVRGTMEEIDAVLEGKGGAVAYSIGNTH